MPEDQQYKAIDDKPIDTPTLQIVVEGCGRKG